MHTSRPTSRRRASSVAALVVAILAATLAVSIVAPARPAEAAGVTTHGWMALEGIKSVRDPDLRALLNANRQQLRAGAMLPDAGYLPGRTFGEEAHWQRFFDAYAARVKARTDCGDITDPHGPCADMIANLMGMASHGLGDEVWDWLFEPNVADLDEYFTPDGGPFVEEGAESQMDVVAIHDHHVPRPVVPDLPSLEVILGAFADVGRADVTAEQFDLAGVGEFTWDLESSWVVQYIDQLKAAMPWTSSHLRTAPGGVDFAGVAIAGMWEWMWEDLKGGDPVTKVVNTYPADGQIDVPASGWVRSIEPGSHRGRGGARVRVAAVLSYSRPYGTSGSPYSGAALPADAFTISELSSGERVDAKDGFPRSVPYGGEAGQKTLGAQPAGDLDPCTWYEASVGVHVPLLDARGEPVAPHSWRFRTDDGAGGTVCPAGPDELVGSVADLDGDPVSGAKVAAYHATDGLVPTAIGVTGQDGTFHLPVLPEGDYAIVAVAQVYDDLAITWWGGGSRATSTAVAPGSTASLDFVVRPAAALSGVALGPGDQPIQGAYVGAYGVGDIWMPTSLAVSDETGSFEFEHLPAGSYSVYVLPPQGAPSSGWWVAEGESVRRSWIEVDEVTARSVEVQLGT